MKRLVTASMALIALQAAPAHAQSKDEVAFGAEMRERLAPRVPGSRVVPTPGEPLSVKLAGGEWDGATVNFHRIYQYCVSTPEDCEATKTEFLENITSKPPTMTSASLRLIVRDAGYVDYVRSLPAASDGTRDFAFFEQIGDDLFVILASDSTHTTALVSGKGLKELGMTRDQAWAIADRQTRANLPPLPTAAQLKGGIVAYQDQEYLASLLIDRFAWRNLAAQIGPDLFVTAVSDGLVIVGVLPDGPDITEFGKSAAEDCAHQQRCISPHVYRYRDGRWTIAK